MTSKQKNLLKGIIKDRTAATRKMSDLLATGDGSWNFRNDIETELHKTMATHEVRALIDDAKAITPIANILADFGLSEVDAWVAGTLIRHA